MLQQLAPQVLLVNLSESGPALQFEGLDGEIPSWDGISVATAWAVAFLCLIFVGFTMVLGRYHELVFMRPT